MFCCLSGKSWTLPLLLPLQPLQIKSVVAPDHVKGYIYVEAYKQTHVKSAIEGIGNLRMGLWNQQMVPIKEMTDVLKVVKEVTNLKPKSWVRLKRGLYKDDIAQVPMSRMVLAPDQVGRVYSKPVLSRWIMWNQVRTLFPWRWSHGSTWIGSRPRWAW